MGDKKISELDVIEFLTERKEKLVAELKSIETTIAGLKSGHDPHFNSEFRQDSNARLIESSLKLAKSKSGNAKSTKVEVPSAYNATDSVDKRIMFVVRSLGQANRNEILEQIKTKYEPNADFEKLEANVKVRLSYLHKNGIIKGERKGRLYSYSLN